MDPVVFAFGDYTLDTEAAELRRGSTIVHLEPRQFDLLVHLVRNMGRVVSHDELNDEVWGGTTTVNGTLHQALARVRHALGQTRGERYPIETVQRRGYRFVGAKESAADQQRAARLLWREYAKSAAQGPRSAAEVIEMADKLVRAERARFGAA